MTRPEHQPSVNAKIPVDPTCPTVMRYVSEVLPSHVPERRKALWRVFEWDHKKSCPRCMEYGCANVRLLG